MSKLSDIIPPSQHHPSYPTSSLLSLLAIVTTPIISTDGFSTPGPHRHRQDLHLPLPTRVCLCHGRAPVMVPRSNRLFAWIALSFLHACFCYSQCVPVRMHGVFLYGCTKCACADACAEHEGEPDFLPSRRHLRGHHHDLGQPSDQADQSWSQGPDGATDQGAGPPAALPITQPFSLLGLRSMMGKHDDLE